MSPPPLIQALPPGGASAYAPVLAAVHDQGFDHPWSASDFATLLDDPTIHAWVGLQGEAQVPVALLLCQVVIDEAEILTICTNPNARRQGWGNHLMTNASTALQAAGVTQWFLEVATDNTPAQALYRAHGFEQVGLRKGYYAPLIPNGPQRDALVMRAPLSLGP
jgi:ribosomal-protein-alanine N-acetyltransferase